MSPVRERNPNYFDLLGLPRRYCLAPALLEERYRDEARAHHPDRHVKDETRLRVASALRTAELTAAYRTLKDPVRRAEYLLELDGVRVCDEHAACPATPEFLGQMMELREGLMEARLEGDESRVAALGVEVRGRYAQAMKEMEEGFARQEEQGGGRPSLGVVRALVALRYYRRFLDELEAHEEATADDRLA